MSVTLDNPRKMPRPRRPRSLGGEGRDPLFRMRSDRIPAELILRTDALRPQTLHACLTPARNCRFEEYQELLHGTRSNWEAC